MFKRRFLPAILLACMTASVDAAAPKPTGEWVVADGSARIRIAHCNDALWGAIAWASDPGRDKNNPDPALRSRSVIGMPILLNMKKTAPNRWDGEIYNAEDGRTYTANISLLSEDVLRVQGCVFGGLFCGGENWTRKTPQSDAPSAAPSAPSDICP